ncbi:MAG: hypothetical protein F6K41_09700 [Symploca sp. SIO3E6]|nr:hypothetical protein [Caldora sp. SIO3E6]
MGTGNSQQSTGILLLSSPGGKKFFIEIASCLLPPAFCLLPSAFHLLPPYTSTIVLI